MKSVTRSILTASAAAIVGLSMMLPATVSLAADASAQKLQLAATATESGSKAVKQKKMKTAHAKMSAERAKELQTALNGAGARLKVDGRLGKHTRAALRKYQKAHRLKVTGRADKETLASLHVR